MQHVLPLETGKAFLDLGWEFPVGRRGAFPVGADGGGEFPMGAASVGEMPRGEAGWIVAGESPEERGSIGRNAGSLRDR